MKTQETYAQMENRHKKELNEFDGMFFAFNNRQFEEGMQKVGLSKDDDPKECLYSIGAGGYIRKDKSKALDDMFERHAHEKEAMRKEQETIKIKFVGVNDWNHPIFKSIEKPYRYYGDVNNLFSMDASEEEVLSKINEDCLYYFGNSFYSEPMGTSTGNIEIVRS